MNSWLNVSCIMVILCAQDFGVAPVTGIQLTSEQGEAVYNAVTQLYQYVSDELDKEWITVEGLEEWKKSIKIDTTKSCDVTYYIEWMKDGAKLIAKVNDTEQENKFDDRIEQAKQEIGKKIIQEDAVGIDEVLDDLKKALKVPNNNAFI